MFSDFDFNEKKKKLIVKLVKLEVKKIPITNQRLFSYEFNDVVTGDVYKCILEKKRGTLKGVIEGDLLEILCGDLCKVGHKKYQINRMRILNNEVY